MRTGDTRSISPSRDRPRRRRASRALRTRWIPLNETAAWNYYVTHRYDDAIRQVRSLLELQPNYGWAYSIMAMSYSGLARHEEAINAAKRGRQLLDTPMVQIAQAVVYANAGRRQAAQRLLAQLTTESDKQYVCGVQLATVYAVLGRTDEAFESLERAYLQRSD